MADVRITLSQEGGDLSLLGLDLERDDGLESAVIVSLFTDARCRPEELPLGEPDRRGYWADAYAMQEGDQTGSLLWLLRREKTINAVLNRARDYARQALQWMIDDRVAAAVEVNAEYLRRGVMGLAVSIYRPTGQRVDYRYDFAWQAQGEREPTTGRQIA